MSTLYELTGAYLQLLDMLESNDNIEDQVIRDTLDGLEGELEIKADAYAKIMKELDADAEKFEKEAKRLAYRSATLSNRSKILKQRLFDSMKATGKEKFKTDLFSFSIQRNGGDRPMKIKDGAAIPEEYCKFVPNNDKIRAALENGVFLEFAELGETGEHLRIR